MELTEVIKLRKREHREKTGLVIVEGYPEVSRASEANIPFEALFVCPEIFTPSKEEFDGYSMTEISKDDFAKIAFGSRLKGILAICHPKQYQLSSLTLGENPLVIVLEGVEKPGNLGAVLRSCDGAGVDAVIMCDGRTDIYNHNVVRSSIGSVFTIPTVSATKEETLQFCQDQKFTIFAASSKADENYTQKNFTKASMILVGNEHEGLSSFWIEHADELVKIPMLGVGQCLNVAVSASVLMYEALRQRKAVIQESLQANKG